MITKPEFDALVQQAWAEKERTDKKYGSKEIGPDNKAKLVATAIENFGTMLAYMRAGRVEESKKCYTNALAHIISMAEHLKQVKPGPQYIDASKMPGATKP